MICAKNITFNNKSANKHTSLANYVCKAQKGNSFQGVLGIEQVPDVLSEFAL